jgi:type I restriction modification DNA specificity family protein
MKKIRLGDLVNTSSGATPLSSNKEYYENGDIPWINSGEVGQYKINFAEKFITKEGFEKSNTKIFPKDTILVAMYGATAGKTSILNINACTNQAVCAILPSENVNNIFLKYKLDSIYDYLVQISSGSARDNLSQKVIQDLEINLPLLETQQKIAKILSDIDDKIEVLHQINDNLAELAKTIYDYWFVQFDFPDENGKPYKTSGGKMVYNEVLKREIPEGWEVCTFSNFIKDIKNGDWGKEQEEGNYTEKVSCIRGADINGLNGNGELKSPIRYINEKNKCKILVENDFIIEISGGSPTQSTGRIALLTSNTFARFKNNIICSNFCKAISLKDEKYTFFFLKEWERLYYNNILFSFEGKTSGIKNFLFEAFIHTYPIISPQKNIIEKYNFYNIKVDENKQKNLQQIQSLQSLRDWLLPMLMNGQVSVE